MTPFPARIEPLRFGICSQEGERQSDGRAALSAQGGTRTEGGFGKGHVFERTRTECGFHLSGSAAPFQTVRPLLVGLAVGALLFAGCASREFSYSTIVSGGETQRFTLVNGRPNDAKAEGIHVVVATIAPKADTHEVLHQFMFLDETGGRNIQHVRVEDVSESAPMLLVDDGAPTVVNRRWSGTSRPFGAQDPALKWVYYVNESVRVYRFTVTMSDGHQIVLHQAAMYPAMMKMLVRGMFGEKY